MTVALYRHYNKESVLLYVGISSSHLARLETHMTSSSWRGEIAFVTMEYFPDRRAALIAEKDTIITERPLHNKVHNKPSPQTGTNNKRHLGVTKKFMDDIYHQIDEQELEDLIDDYNSTQCSKYLVYCEEMIKGLADHFGIDFDNVIAPQLIERNLLPCNDNCPECLENREFRQCNCIG